MSKDDLEKDSSKDDLEKDSSKDDLGKESSKASSSRRLSEQEIKESKIVVDINRTEQKCEVSSSFGKFRTPSRILIWGPR